MFLDYLFKKVVRLSRRQIVLPLKGTKRNISNKLVPCGGEWNPTLEQLSNMWSCKNPTRLEKSILYSGGWPCCGGEIGEKHVGSPARLAGEHMLRLRGWSNVVDSVTKSKEGVCQWQMSCRLVVVGSQEPAMLENNHNDKTTTAKNQNPDWHN